MCVCVCVCACARLRGVCAFGGGGLIKKSFIFRVLYLRKVVHIIVQTWSHAICYGSVCVLTCYLIFFMCEHVVRCLL